MKNSDKNSETLRHKNWVLLAILVGLILLLYGLSFVKFGQAVYS